MFKIYFSFLSTPLYRSTRRLILSTTTALSEWNHVDTMRQAPPLIPINNRYHYFEHFWLFAIRTEQSDSTVVLGYSYFGLLIFYQPLPLRFPQTYQHKYTSRWLVSSHSSLWMVNWDMTHFVLNIIYFIALLASKFYKNSAKSERNAIDLMLYSSYQILS